MGITENMANDTVQFTYLYSEGLKNKMLGRKEMAYTQFTQCLKMNPVSTASAFQLAILNFEDTNYLAAKEQIEFCLKLKPDNEWYLLLRSSIAEKLLETDVYQNTYEKLVKLKPKNLDYSYELALIYYENKSYTQSLAILNNLEQEIGVNENLSFLKNNINYDIGNYDAIQFELMKLIQFFPDSLKYSDMLAEYYLNFRMPDKALKMYEQVLEIDKNNINAKLGISFIFAKTSNFKKGYNFLIDCLEDTVTDISRKLKVADLYLDETNNQINEDSILRIYHLLAKKSNVGGEFISKYISYLYKIKDLSEAEKIALIAIDKYPDNFTNWGLYFDILFLQNRPEALNKTAKRALEYFPNQPNVYFYAGYSYFLLHNYKDAVNLLEVGLDYVIEDEDLEKQFYVTLAESYHNIGKHTQSDKYFDKYLEKDSTNAYLMNNFAYYLVKRNLNLDKALNLSRRSIEIEPFNSSFLDTYSWILYTSGENEKALNYIQRAYKYGGNKNPVILEHYGDILHKSGDIVEAVNKWKEAYKINNSKIILEKIKANTANNN